MRYVKRTVMLSEGEVVRLHRPTFGVEGETYGLIARTTQLDARLAPSVFGLGLLEAISDQDILAGADPKDRDGDGISGRAAIVDGAIGRIGWKARQSRIADQNVKALSLDIGIGNRRHAALWGGCTAAQTKCRDGPHGGSSRHDGLAGVAEDTATARGWRTALLWGIGLTQAVSGHAFYLHDDRARGLTEVVLWHGGEAQPARNRFAALAKRHRDALLVFLTSL